MKASSKAYLILLVNRQTKHLRTYVSCIVYLPFFKLELKLLYLYYVFNIKIERLWDHRLPICIWLISNLCSKQSKEATSERGLDSLCWGFFLHTTSWEAGPLEMPRYAIADRFCTFSPLDGLQVCVQVKRVKCLAHPGTQFSPPGLITYL